MMQKMHFSLPVNVLAWLQKKANEAGMRRSHFLAHILMKLMDEENSK